MTERDGIEELRDLQRRERERFNELAEKQGLRRLYHEYSTVWVPKDQEEVGAIPSKFFVQKYDKDEQIVLDEHRIAFPIKDPSQLSASLKALNALYSGVENAVFDRNDLTMFVEFVGGLVEPKQPKV